MQSRCGFEVLFGVVMPVMHSESLDDHRKAAAVITELIAKGQREKEATLVGMLTQTQQYMGQHTKVLEKFGRYPSRNGAMGRENTAAEEVYLAGPLSDWCGRLCFARGLGLI